MVSDSVKLLDKIHLQKYIYLLSLFVSEEIEAVDFEKLFLGVRREDGYWLSGKFDNHVSKILDAFFLDVDEYNPNGLFNPKDEFNINEVDLRKRAGETLSNLKNLCGKS